MDDQLRRIEIVTRHYEQLQGLRVAWLGCVFAIFGFALFWSGLESDWEFFALLTPAVAVLAVGHCLLGRYYRTTFGTRVRSEDMGELFWPMIAIPIATTTGHNLLSLGPFGASLPVVGCHALWIAVRDWPQRGYYLVPFAVASVGMALQMVAAGPVTPALDGATLMVIGAAYVPVGFLDHRMLVSVMRRDEPSRHAASADVQSQ